MPDKDLHWKTEKTPASLRYGDIYFSAEDGLLESRHVFLNGIDAPFIWQDKDRFTLLENGFGTGLNFIMTCHSWLRTAPPGACMTYITTEKHPLNKDDMAQCLSFWPELAEEACELLRVYDPLGQGFHQRNLFEGRIKIIFLIGESAEMLPQLEAHVDAFYLDGFAPNRNPDMWTAEIFSDMARLARPSAPIATFTAAGFVRRGLEKKGFQMHKTAGYGQKRESLRGIYLGKQPPKPNGKPWFQRPAPLAKGSHIAVIGGGIAGLTTGLALQNSGYKVIIYDRDDKPMNRASGNPVGILDPSLSASESPEGCLARAAVSHSLNFYQSLNPDIFLHHGLMKFAATSPHGTLYFPELGAISPPEIRRILSEKLSLKMATNITHIVQNETTQNKTTQNKKWHLFEGDECCAVADAIVICGGPDSINFAQSHHIPLDPVRGQITYLSQGKNPPKDVLCGKGYVIPPLNLDGKMTIVTGASFHRGDRDLSLRAEDHMENITQAKKLWPDIGHSTVIGGRCALRAYSPDHLPICGPMPDLAQYHSSYSTLKHGPKHKEFPPASYQPNLYITAGLGARGFLVAPLLADIMAALISGAPLPIARKIYESLHPGRFLIRKLSKAK